MRLVLTPFAIGFLVVSASAQQIQPRQSLQRAVGAPQFAGSYHPAVGFESSGSRVPRLGPATTYNNTTLTNYYAIPATREEWIDEGQLLSRNTGDWEQVNGFEFAYCSTDSNPNGVPLVVTFYDEVTVCGGPQSTVWPAADCSYHIFGLPGGSNGNLGCWSVSVSLSGFECELTTDAGGGQLFGFGQMWPNPNTGPWVASGGLGNDNSFVSYDTQVPNANAAFVGCFFFGGTPHAGFAFATYGNPDETRTLWSAAGPGTGDSLELGIDASAQVGSAVSLSVLDGPFGSPVPSLLWISPNRVDRPVVVIDAHELAEYSSRVYQNFSASGVHALTVPNRAGTWYSQAAVVSQGSARLMSNALEHLVR